MPYWSITSLYTWEEHVTLKSLQVLCVGWKTGTGVCFTAAYTGEKKNKELVDMVLPISQKLDVGNNCTMLKVYDVVHE